jgi:hypothetical protein
MTDIIVIYEYGARICSFTTSVLTGAVSADIPPRSARLLREYLDLHTAIDGKVHIELSLALHGDVLDARLTELFFLVSAALIKSGAWHRLSDETVRAFSPFIRARTAAAQIRIERLRKMREFIRICRVSMGSAVRGIVTPEEALSRMTEALPPAAAMRLEYEDDPAISDIIRRITDYSRGCADDRYYRALLAYADSIGMDKEQR